LKVDILDTRNEGDATCFLCKVDLEDYINSLPHDYKDWHVQRGIVGNTYLDSLIETVIEKKHIPPLVLLIDKEQDINESVDSFRILDGLQRTHRLKQIKNSIDFVINKIKEENDFLTISPVSLSRRFSSEINSLGASVNLVRRLMDAANLRDINYIRDCLSGNYQWVEIWSGLTPKLQVEKMLMLNAGHKAVTPKHQVEVLFTALIPEIYKASKGKIKLVFDKEVSSTSYSKQRQVGEFHFSHIISALVSLAAGKPINTNADFIQKVQSDQKALNFDYETIKASCRLLIELDEGLTNTYGIAGTRWMGREVVLTGVMGAIGKHSEDHTITVCRTLDKAQKVFNNNYAAFNLIEFDEVRNSLDLSKINIGNVNKKAIYAGIRGLLADSDTPINWSQNFYDKGKRNA
jgi:hypothetical protein